MRVTIWYYTCAQEQVHRFKVASCSSVTNNGRIIIIIKVYATQNVGRDISVAIATHYGLDGPRTESQCDENFRTHPDGPGAQPASFKIGTGSFRR